MIREYIQCDPRLVQEYEGETLVAFGTVQQCNPTRAGNGYFIRVRLDTGDTAQLHWKTHNHSCATHDTRHPNVNFVPGNRVRVFMGVVGDVTRRHGGMINHSAGGVVVTAIVDDDGVSFVGNHPIAIPDATPLDVFRTRQPKSALYIAYGAVWRYAMAKSFQCTPDEIADEFTWTEIQAWAESAEGRRVRKLWNDRVKDPGAYMEVK